MELKTFIRAKILLLLKIQFGRRWSARLANAVIGLRLRVVRRGDPGVLATRENEKR